MKKLTIFAIAAALLWPGAVFAHGGGLDRNDCHRETATGGYHCHPQDDGEVDWGIVAAVGGGLLGLWLLIDLLDDDMSLAQPLRVAPYVTDQDEAGLVAEYEFENGHRLGFRTEHRMDGPQDETRFSIRWSVGF